MRNPVICATTISRGGGTALYPQRSATLPLNYGWAARAARALADWLVRHFGQPTLTEEEAFLAQAADHADCERRERLLARRSVDAWWALS